MIKFSVIIPNYNHAAFLNERIGSVLTQTYKPAEIIILDDASSDNSREIIAGYKDDSRISHLLFNDDNSGSPFRQWKKGIIQASGDWIWIAESDDIADPLFLETANECITKNPETGIFYCDSACRSEDNNPLRYSFFSEMKNRFFKTSRWSSGYSIEGKEEINLHLKYFCTINNTSAAVFRKDLLLAILNKLDTYIYHGDWYAQLAVAMHANITYSPKALNTFRMHGNSFLLTSNALQSKLECFRILDFLYQQDFVNDKKVLVDFFTLQYLGFGIMKDGYQYGKRLFASYAEINKPLSRKVLRSLVWQKITGKKHKTIF